MAISNISNGESGSDARTSLNQAIDAVNGLGDASTKNVGSTAGTVCAGDDSRLSNTRAPTAHASTHINGTDDIQDATSLQKGLATATQIAKLEGIEAGADVTDAGNIGSAIGGSTAITTIGDTDQVPVVQTATLKSVTYGAFKTLLNAIYQAKATILSTFSTLSNADGFLKNDGAGVLSYVGTSSITAGQATAAMGLKTTTTTVAVSSAAAPTAGQVLTATSGTAAGWATPEGGGGGGKVAQMVYVSSSTPASSSLTFPADNTLPQISEGDALTALDATITPTNAGSTLLVRVIVNCCNNSGIHMAVALFRDSDADSIQAQSTAFPVNYSTFICFEASVPANSTTATTFKIRYGGLGPCTMYINTIGATQYLGGAVKSTITVEELLP